MKKLFLSIAILISVATTTLAQSKGSYRTKSSNRLSYEKLDLTEDQKKKIQKLDETFNTQLKDIQNNSSLTKVDKHDKSRSLREKRREDIEKILTTEQQNKLAQFKEQSRNKNNKHRQKNKAHFAHKNTKLDSSTIASLDALEDKYYIEKKTIRNSNITVEEQQKQIDALRKKYRDEKHKLIQEYRKGQKITS